MGSRGVVPFVKVDKGLEAEKGRCQVMRPMRSSNCLPHPGRRGLGVVGTKMRSSSNLASKAGIAGPWWRRVSGWVAGKIAGIGEPIIEHESSIKSRTRPGRKPPSRVNDQASRAEPNGPQVR